MVNKIKYLSHCNFCSIINDTKFSLYSQPVRAENQWSDYMHGLFPDQILCFPYRVWASYYADHVFKIGPVHVDNGGSDL